MILHRSRTWLIQVAIALIAPFALVRVLLLFRHDVQAGLPPVITVREALALLVGLPSGVYVMVRTFGALRFRFVIHANGLDIRTPDLTDAVRWTDVESILMDDMRVLVFPAPGYRADPYPGMLRHVRTAADGRRCYEILALGQVRESPDRIAAALAAHAGTRFTDLRRAA
ncbi:hypothetical protein Cs7R123_61730 [Catellatospora sp. TT07R-123]|uniref:hypothetical protein n=1 Tax=Catellatospora sp. TT07R-123 TaxID=2733863 RepID=UPI001B02C2E6|nr:hypothetical protein [Catellatospora sp. TT07R-123]GHJ48831.1 hypothetical protein Cs7R123_61730 [Catellatospora sp. TT07R-123]